MIARFVVDSLLMWSAQVMILVAVAALACLALPHARARLFIWQGVLAVSLLLPFIMPTRLPDPIEVTQSTDIVPANFYANSIVRVPVRQTFWRGEAILWILAGVALARLCWLGFGIQRLRRLRKCAQLLANPPLVDQCKVKWYVSDTAPGPVTFGWKRPTILLPRSVLEMPRELLEAVAGHELIHVFRRDWAVVLGEEVLRSLLWFHPAIWFVLGEIQIAREEVVDAEAIRMTRDPENYLDALLAVAQQRMVQDLAPAPLFLKKRQLARRVASLVKESSVCTKNLGARVALVVTTTLAGLGAAAWFFPFPSAAQSVPDDPGISVVAGGQLVHRPALHLGKTSGTVVLDASLDNKGEVADAHVVSGPNELRREALTNVLQWHYSSNGAPSTVRISIQYGPSALMPLIPSSPPPPPPPPPGMSQTLVVKDIVFSGVDSGVQDQIRNQLPFHVGDTINLEAIRAAVITVQGIDEHLLLGVSNRKTADGATESTVRITVRPAAIQPPLQTANPVMRDDSGVSQRLRVGGNVQAANLVTKVTPPYPAEAKQARLQGTVRFNAVIAVDGTIKTLELVSGHPLFVPSALEAVKQWVYRPTLLNGQPVEVETQIDVNYTLSQ